MLLSSLVMPLLAVMCTEFPVTLNATQMGRAASLGVPADLLATGSSLAPFLKPRVSDTQGNSEVRAYLIDLFNTLGWSIELDTFNESTPFGLKSFTNIVATMDQHAERRITLAAHYDSKFFEKFNFVGATDSAVPCAILVDLAIRLTPLMRKNQHIFFHNGPQTTLQIIFFDGEEAFVEWTPTDSIYGARHLAAKWEDSMVEIQCSLNDPDCGSRYLSKIDQIDVLVLLDLLGKSDAKIPSIHPETACAFFFNLGMFDRLIDIQKRLVVADLVSNELQERVNNPHDGGIFQENNIHSIQPLAIQDDHVPFFKLGVPVCHLIPVPFPKEWHTEGDDHECISHATVVDLSLIFRVLIIEYLNLPV